jgi:MFS family permease
MRINALAALRHRNFRWFWIGGMGFSAAQGIQQLAIAWLVLDITDSVGQLGFVIFLQGIPMSLIALFGGVLADRYDRRMLLMVSQLITGLSLVALAVLTIADVIQIWQVYVASALLGAMLSITMPARSALVWSLVSREDLPNAIALNSMQLHASRIVWPTLAGGLIAVLGVGAALTMSAIGCGIGIVGLMLVRGISNDQPRRTTSAAADALEGVRYILATPRVRGLLSLSLSTGAFGMAFMSLAPGFAREILGFNSSETGLFVMMSGAGALIGSAIMVVVDLGNRMRLLALVYGGFVLTILIMAVNTWDPIAYAGMAGFGFVLGCVSVAGQTLFQRQVPPQFLGRVLSVWGLAGGAGFLIALPLGLIGDLLGLRWALGVGAAITLSFAFWRAFLFGFPPYTDEVDSQGEKELEQGGLRDEGIGPPAVAP